MGYCPQIQVATVVYILLRQCKVEGNNYCRRVSPGSNRGVNSSAQLPRVRLRLHVGNNLGRQEGKLLATHTSFQMRLSATYNGGISQQPQEERLSTGARQNSLALENY
jgi:hypothetical protein